MPRVSHVQITFAVMPLYLLAAVLLVLLHDRSSWLCCRCSCVRAARALIPCCVLLLEGGGDSWHSSEFQGGQLELTGCTALLEMKANKLRRREMA